MYIFGFHGCLNQTECWEFPKIQLFSFISIYSEFSNQIVIVYWDSVMNSLSSSVGMENCYLLFLCTR